MCRNKSAGQCEHEMRVLARYAEYIMQGAQLAGRIQRPECLTITGNTPTRQPSYAIRSIRSFPESIWQARIEGEVGQEHEGNTKEEEKIGYVVFKCNIHGSAGN
jgi:hypothetical protein